MGLQFPKKSNDTLGNAIYQVLFTRRPEIQDNKLAIIVNHPSRVLEHVGEGLLGVGGGCTYLVPGQLWRWRSGLSLTQDSSPCSLENFGAKTSDEPLAKNYIRA